jgi:hypothetical protein
LCIFYQPFCIFLPLFYAHILHYLMFRLFFILHFLAFFLSIHFYFTSIVKMVCFAFPLFTFLWSITNPQWCYTAAICAIYFDSLIGLLLCLMVLKRYGLSIIVLVWFIVMLFRSYVYTYIYMYCLSSVYLFSFLCPVFYTIPWLVLLVATLNLV